MCGSISELPSSVTEPHVAAGPGSALVSKCGGYRYLLTRQFKTGTGSCLFVMLNPSIADACTDDPTIMRCAGFAMSWGFRELRVVNLFALRSTDPQQLELVEDPIGPKNDVVLRSELQDAGLVAAAWGNREMLHERSSAVREMMLECGIPAVCLGLNRTGEPIHPLYVPATARPLPL